MDEKLKDQDVLLVKEKDKEKLGVVVGQNVDGTPRTFLPQNGHNSNFLLIDKHADLLENFFKNFVRQMHDPTRFQFFKSPENKSGTVAKDLEAALKNPENPANKATLDMHRVEPEAFAKKQSNHAIDESRIDWSQLERLGVYRERLEKTGSLDAMLNWQKSPVLIPIVAKFDDVTLRTDARLSFREMPDGKLSVAIHALRKEPELDKPFYGVTLNEDDKKHILTTGNLGRLINATYTPGEKTPVFVSLDKLTNELVAVRADKIRIPENIKGIQLDDKQKQALAEGKPVYLENMTSKNGKDFSAYVQVNADKRGIEFRFDNDKKQEQSQQTKQGQPQNGEVRIPKTLLGVELSDKQQENLKAGQTVYVAGMKDKTGQDFNAYVKVSADKNELKFYKWNPDKAKKQGAEVTPDNASKTQVAVNSEGKTNETTKKVGEPLKKGQTQPTEKQEAKQEKKEVQENKPQKSRGRKM
ncbi:hypothetical protein Barb7_00258 [Bacteroidales bacterium Barb7]|nr:hypothetical protein Barb7_00258 [Bacteroidales bacterium Barb7]